MGAELSFQFNSATAFNLHLPELMNFVSQIDGNYKLTVEKVRQKRSLNANAYLWEMCGKLSEELSKDGTLISKEDVYKKAIKECGIYKDFLNLSQKDASTLRHAWEMLGVGWITEQVDYMPDGENVVVRCYYGSSQYNTKQMARIIDYIVQDCKAVGIEVMSDRERSLLIEEWGKSSA